MPLSPVPQPTSKITFGWIVIQSSRASISSLASRATTAASAYLTGDQIMLFKKLMFLLPPTCVLCGLTSRQPSNICLPCQKNLPILAHHCPQCAQILPTSEALCVTCLQTPPPFDHTFALFPYVPPIIRLIRALKFQHKLNHAELL